MKRTSFSGADALKVSVSLALAAGMTTAAPGVFAQEETATEGRVEVTGSRIKRADIEGALPVTVIDRTQIELSGQISVADLLRNTSFNSFGSFRPQSGSSAQSFAGISIRGLGSGRTLILIDGRRAPVAPNVGSAQDLNSIPLAAVERIEILSDGASAIYGTDAIGGVVNIITRKDFNGVEITMGMGRPKRVGGDTDEGSVIFGASSANARVLAGAAFNNRGIIFQRDRAWSAGGISSFSNNFLAGGPFVAFLRHPTFGSANVPGCQGPGFTVSGQGTTSGFCAYDFTFVAADEAEIHNQSLFTRGSFQINDDWSTYMNASVSRVKSFGRYAPVPSSPWPGGAPFLPWGSPNHPATPPGSGGLNPNWASYQTPLNPVNCPASGTSGGTPCTPGALLYFRYDPNVATGGVVAGARPNLARADLWFRHRFAALGNRDTLIDSNVYDVQVGFMGRVGEVDLDFGIRQTESKYIDLGRNYVAGGLAQQQFDAGNYNIYDPFGNDRAIMDSMIATINRDSRFLGKELYAIGSMDLFEMDGGVAGMAAGVEYREEDYADIYDTLSSSGQIVGSAGNSSFGARDVTALFFEVLLPVIPDLEIGIAGRYDDYSDYGSDFSPKISARWQPMDTLTVRASYGQGFRAPTLDIVSAQPAFSAAGTAHVPTVVALGGTPGQSTQVTTYQIANPNATSEQSDQFSLGAAWDAADWLNMSLDYYNIEITDRSAFIGINTIVACAEGTTQNCPPGLSDWSNDPSITLASIPDPSIGLGVKFAGGPGTAILFGQTGFANLGTINTSGLDFNARTRFEFAGFGQLESNLQLSYVLEYEVDSGADIVGDRGNPAIRGVLSNVWSYGDYQVVWNLNYVGDQPDAAVTAGPDPQPSWTTHDLQVNYYAPWNGRMTFGVLNIADKDPPVDQQFGRGFNFSLYNGYGRVPYLRYTQTF